MAELQRAMWGTGEDEEQLRSLGRMRRLSLLLNDTSLPAVTPYRPLDHIHLFSASRLEGCQNSIPLDVSLTHFKASIAAPGR